MEPNQNTNTVQNTAGASTVTNVSSVSSTPLAASDVSVRSSKAGSDVVFQDKPKKNMGMILTIVLLVLLAAGGIGFGVWTMMDGNSQVAKRDEQIAELKKQIADMVNGVDTSTGDNSDEMMNSDTSLPIDGLYLVSSIVPERHYYLGVTDLDRTKDSREIDTYLIDTTKFGTEGGILKYDIKTVLDRITDEKVASLPDTLAEGTTNARPKSSCKSFRVRIGDVDENPKNINWVYGQEWGDLLPLTVYTECVVEDGKTISQSLGTAMYALNPQTGDYIKITDEWQ